MCYERFNRAQLELLTKLNNLPAKPGCPRGCGLYCDLAVETAFQINSGGRIEVAGGGEKCPNVLAVALTVQEIIEQGG